MRASLDSVTLDQLRLFISVAEQGSFSAAGRQLHRAQSAVSSGVANLESLLGLQLFDRSGHRPALTEVGRTLLSDARKVLDDVSVLGARAANVGQGLELQLRLAVDTICPSGLLIASAKALRDQYPTVSLRVQTEVLDDVAAVVLDRSCQIGISGPVGSDAAGLERRFLAHVAMVPVAAPEHPLATIGRSISHADARSHVQIVISQRVATAADNHGVVSDATWLVADASTKLELVRAGLGWGNLPIDMVQEDLERRRLVRLTLDEWGAEPLLVPLYVITRRGSPPWPAGQWLARSLPSLSGDCPRLMGAGVS